MSMSRRQFIEAATAAAGASLAASCTSSSGGFAPHRVTLQNKDDGSVAASIVSEGGGPVTIPSSLAMNSGSPLGGIGTGFIEIRPDGTFNEWLIFNSKNWSPRKPQSQNGGDPSVGPQTLEFLVRTQSRNGVPQLRRLYLRAQENNLYSLAYVQDVESIEYDAWFPMTTLRYNDASLPVRVSAAAFSPFTPGKARDSATPGFHMVFSIENTSSETVEVSLLSLLENPLAFGLENRQLSNTLSKAGGTTSLLLQTDAAPENRTTIGSLCLSVTGGDHSWITGTYQPFTSGGPCRWQSSRVNSILLDALHDFYKAGRLPSTSTSHDPARDFTLSDAQIDALSDSDRVSWRRRLSEDALLKRVFDDATAADPQLSADAVKSLMREIRRNISGNTIGPVNQSKWGAGALASSVTLAPGQKTEVRFTFSWFFPHHFSSRGPEMGHMYANWFNSAADVDRYLQSNYTQHRASTENFARTLADTSLGAPLAFVWSSQLGTLVKNTWWIKDGGYAVWEGLGCCGLSTTDVDFDGSFSIVALFPELKLSQMRRIIAHQRPTGQVPHNFDSDLDHVDNGWARVDMNPQFVMMVCRDYLWTGDRQYLTDMWPHVVSAMDYTASLDSDGDGLPDRNTGLQTYDQWAMRGAPSYISSLWIGALRAAIRLARDAGKPDDVRRWTDALAKSSATFDKLLFNGEYYSLWVDGQARSETCMSDQISGEWFSRLIGLTGTISGGNLSRAVDAIVKYNFSPETGLRNASAPKGGASLLVLGNLQAGGVWSGIEFAFASFLMDQGRHDEGARIVEAVHRRYLRAGSPWNHVECGGHYTRAMSSWATLLAATGFKPDLPAASLTIAPSISGDFHAPWATSTGFGQLRRKGGALSIRCDMGTLAFRSLKVRATGKGPSVHLGSQALDNKSTQGDGLTSIEFTQLVSLAPGRSLTVE